MMSTTTKTRMSTPTEAALRELLDAVITVYVTPQSGHLPPWIAERLKQIECSEHEEHRKRKAS